MERKKERRRRSWLPGWLVGRAASASASASAPPATYADGNADGGAALTTEDSSSGHSSKLVALRGCQGWAAGDVVVLGDDGRGQVRASLIGGKKNPSPSPPLREWRPHGKSVASADCNGRVLVTGGRDLKVRCWDEALCMTWEAPGHAHELSVSGVAVHPRQDSVVASGSRDSSVRVWDTQTSAAPVAFAKLARNLVTCLAFGEEEPRLLWQGAESLVVHCWDWARSPLLAPSVSLPGYLYFPTCMAMRGNVLVTGSTGFDGDGCETHLWDVRSAKAPLAALRCHAQEVVGCAFLGDGHVVTASKDGKVVLLDVASLSVTSTTQAQGAPCTALCRPAKTASQAAVVHFDGSLSRLDMDLKFNLGPLVPST